MPKQPASPSSYPPSRDALPRWLNEQGLLGAGAEIGCATGDYSVAILKEWKGHIMYLVDPWVRQSPWFYSDPMNDVTNWDECYEVCKARVEIFPNARIIRKKSVEAAAMIADASLDWVYIDAAHDYANAMQDLNSWWPKIRVGGILGGHDYFVQQIEKETFPWSQVEEVVTTWTQRKGLQHFHDGANTFWIPKKS